MLCNLTTIVFRMGNGFFSKERDLVMGNNLLVQACPFCVAGRPGCEYGVSLFQRASQLFVLLPDGVWLSDLTQKQLTVYWEWQRLAELYCAHIGSPVQKDPD